MTTKEFRTTRPTLKLESHPPSNKPFLKSEPPQILADSLRLAVLIV
jgi:hypothetical protein